MRALTIVLLTAIPFSFIPYFMGGPASVGLSIAFPALLVGFTMLQAVTQNYETATDTEWKRPEA